MEFKIHDLLASNEVNQIRLVAGQKSMANMIRNVNILDNPDTFDWLSPGDLILTTGYIFKDDEKQQRNLIRELSEISCAGLAIKIKRYLNEIPIAMVQEADKYNLPLIEIPFCYTLAHVSNVVNNEIFKREDTILQKYFKIHSMLMDCTLKGGDLSEVSKTVSELISNPLIIVDSNWRLLSYAEHPDNKVRLDHNLNMVKKEHLFDKEFIEGVPKDVGEMRKAIKRIYYTSEGSIACRIIPVVAEQHIYGYLIAWESVSKLKSIEYLALEQAATIVALDRIRTKKVEETKRLIRQDFFDDLLAGRIESVSAVNSLAEIHGMNPNKRYACIVIKINEFANKSESEMLTDRIDLTLFKEKLISVSNYTSIECGRNVHSIHRGALLILFISLKDSEDSSKLHSVIGDFVERLYDKIIFDNEKPDINVGVGRSYNNILEMKKSFLEAQEAINISKRISYSKRTSNERKIAYFEKLAIYQILESDIPAEVLDNFFDVTIGKLVKYDQENSTDMVDTLDQYFINSCNISTSAKCMYLHRNTMLYRIKKIKSILNSELQDAEELLELQLGLHIMRIKNKHSTKKH